MMSTRSAADSHETRPRRRLIWIPIVHTQDDMGKLGESVKNEYLRRLGKEQWETHLRAVDAFWTAIRRKIEGLGLDYPRVRIYQDGLPVCDHEEQIVRELADRGNVNQRLIVDLIDRGARLTGTESPQLLMEEYQLNRRILGVDRASSLRATIAGAPATGRATARETRPVRGRQDRRNPPGRRARIDLPGDASLVG